MRKCRALWLWGSFEERDIHAKESHETRVPQCVHAQMTQCLSAVREAVTVYIVLGDEIRHVALR